MKKWCHCIFLSVLFKNEAKYLFLNLKISSILFSVNYSLPLSFSWVTESQNTENFRELATYILYELQIPWHLYFVFVFLEFCLCFSGLCLHVCFCPLCYHTCTFHFYMSGFYFFVSFIEIWIVRRSHPGAEEMNLTRNHEVEGSIPGLFQWVKNLALLWAVVQFTDATQILHCYGCAVGQQL